MCNDRKYSGMMRSSFIAQFQWKVPSGNFRKKGEVQIIFDRQKNPVLAGIDV